MFLFVFKTKRELKCQNELFFNIIRSVCFDYWEFLTNLLTYFLTMLFDAVQNSSFCGTVQGRNPHNIWFIFWEKRWLHKFILKWNWPLKHPITILAHIRLSLFHSDRLSVTIKAPVWKTRYQLSEFKSKNGPFCIFLL